MSSLSLLHSSILLALHTKSHLFFAICNSFRTSPSYHVISSPVSYYFILSYPILTYPILYPIMCYPNLPKPILSYDFIGSAGEQQAEWLRLRDTADSWENDVSHSYSYPYSYCHYHDGIRSLAMSCNSLIVKYRLPFSFSFNLITTVIWFILFYLYAPVWIFVLCCWK